MWCLRLLHFIGKREQASREEKVQIGTRREKILDQRQGQAGAWPRGLLWIVSPLALVRTWRVREAKAVPPSALSTVGLDGSAARGVTREFQLHAGLLKKPRDAAKVIQVPPGNSAESALLGLQRLSC